MVSPSGCHPEESKGTAEPVEAREALSISERVVKEPTLGRFDGVDTGRETPRCREFDSRTFQPGGLALGKVV